MCIVFSLIFAARMSLPYTNRHGEFSNSILVFPSKLFIPSESGTLPDNDRFSKLLLFFPSEVLHVGGWLEHDCCKKPSCFHSRRSRSNYQAIRHTLS